MPSTTTINLINEPTPMCSLAISVAIAGQNPWDRVEPYDYPSPTVVPQSISNPDVSGIGLLVAFLATAYAAFLWMLIAYLLRWLPSELLGEADAFAFRRPAHERPKPSWWQKAADQMILAFADQQIVTGIAILAAGYIKVQSLTVYHQQVIIYLAWMSSNTHLTALSLLQVEFRSGSKMKLRSLRLTGILILGIMLLVALVPTAGANWVTVLYGGIESTSNVSFAAGVPAICLWKPSYSGGISPDAIWSFIILALSYVWKMASLFEAGHKLFKFRFRQKVQGRIEALLDRIIIRVRRHRKTPFWLFFCYKTVLCVYLIVWASVELANSFVVSLWICGGGIVWGSMQILYIRQYLPLEVVESENSWSFGQLLPIFLLALPISVFAECYWSHKHESHDHGDGIVREDREACPSDTGMQNVTAIAEDEDRFDDPSLIAEIIDLQSNADQTQHPPNTHSITHESLHSMPSSTHPPTTLQKARSPAQPCWKSVQTLQRSRFIQSFFWIFQFNMLCTLAAFFPLFFLWLNTSGAIALWMVIAFIVTGWVAWMLVWFAVGVSFSRLFEVQVDAATEEALEGTST